MGLLDGKVAFVTGAARAQGRSHVLRLAEEGADIIAIDICRQIESVPYDMATSGDLAETANEVRARGRRIVALEADVRDERELQSALEAGIAELGPVEIVIANAGIATFSVRQPHRAWQDVIDVNLTGVFNTVETVIPHMIEHKRGGSIVLISSTAGLSGILGPSRGALAYTAAKHGVVGLMRSYANNLAQHSIRVNTVHPTGVDTPMIANEAMQEYLALRPAGSGSMSNALPIQTLDPNDVSDAVMWLVSDQARYVTGITLPVDAGSLNKK